MTELIELTDQKESINLECILKKISDQQGKSKIILRAVLEGKTADQSYIGLAKQYCEKTYNWRDLITINLMQDKKQEAFEIQLKNGYYTDAEKLAFVLEQITGDSSFVKRVEDATLENKIINHEHMAAARIYEKRGDVMNAKKFYKAQAFKLLWKSLSEPDSLESAIKLIENTKCFDDIQKEFFGSPEFKEIVEDIRKEGYNKRRGNWKGDPYRAAEMAITAGYLDWAAEIYESVLDYDRAIEISSKQWHNYATATLFGKAGRWLEGIEFAEKKIKEEKDEHRKNSLIYKKEELTKSYIEHCKYERFDEGIAFAEKINDPKLKDEFVNLAFKHYDKNNQFSKSLTLAKKLNDTQKIKNYSVLIKTFPDK